MTRKIGSLLKLSINKAVLLTWLGNMRTILPTIRRLLGRPMPSDITPACVRKIIFMNYCPPLLYLTQFLLNLLDKVKGLCGQIIITKLTHKVACFYRYLVLSPVVTVKHQQINAKSFSICVCIAAEEAMA